VEESSKAIASYEKWIVECAKDLLSNRGQCLVVAGHKQPLAVHVMANAMNAALGNIGKTVLMLPAEQPKVRSIADLAGALNDGKVDTLVILGGNPVYNAPVDLNWAAAQAKAKTVVRLGYYEDESFPQSGWALPMAHYLESWGDARTADGTLVPIQPLILPLFDGMTELELIARIAGMDVTSPYEIVRETFRGIAGKSEEDWKTFLHDGYLANSAAKPVDVQLNARATNGSIGPVTAPTKDSLEVIFHRDYKMDDGRFNNNGWLQELPDPISKMTWENVIMMSIATAKQLGVYAPNPENNRMLAPWVKLELNGRQVEGPVWSQPGQADNTIGLALGYGRQKTGRVGINSGYDAYKLRTTTALYIAPGAKLTKTGKKHAISPTQDHGAMEGRPVIREATLEEYREHPTFATLFNMEEPPTGNVSLYPNPLDAVKSDRHQWAMSIDLNSCVGCATCVMACQSENNIPIVGKEQVSNNREMHWIRIDRYFTGSPDREDEIQAVNQPMLCQHCEAAPCENVCPVNATVHDQEGLNVMAYNRCVGTRYCSNNCPYKVRRFNFFDYNRRTFAQLQSPYTTPLFPTRGQNSVLDWLKDPDRGSQPTDQWELLKLVKNPDVTVRMRGVMEKCSYCVQRIEAAKITAKVKAGASDDVRVPTDSFKTACQQACPADAIVFGNLLDEQSKIVERKANDRNYRVLDFLNTRPRTTYLARVRNPNPAMPDAYKTPHSTEEYIKENHNLYDEGGQPVPAARKEKPSIGEPEKGAL
jgi:molybdopterin-containing oxidoreductase family iron-sulfur binding subunit